MRWIFHSLALVFSTWCLAKSELNDEQYFLRMIKEDQIEKKLLNSQVFKDCATKGNNDDDRASEMAKCISEKVAKLDKTSANKLIDALELGKEELFEDPNQKNLAKYLSNLVETALYGKDIDKPGVKNAINQSMFTEVYERVVGKALFLEISQYCLEKNNILPSGTPSTTPTVNPLEQIINLKDTDGFVKTCIKGIGTSCEKDDQGIIIDHKGCLFRRRLVEYKTILSKLKSDKDFWEEAKKEAQNYLKLEFLDKNIGRSSVDIANDLTTINSSMIVDEGYQEKSGYLSNQATEMEQTCLIQKTDESCKKFFKKGTKESLGEYRLKKELEIELKIKHLENSNLNELKKEAQSSSYFSKSELESLMSSSDLDAIKNAIKEKYDEEKESIKKIIDEKIQLIGIKKDEDLQNAHNQLGNIAQMLKGRPDEIRAVNFFSNIIVATFDFKGDKKGNKRVLSNVDSELRALQSQTSNSNAQKYINYLSNLKQGREAASIEENHIIQPEDLDAVLFP